MDSSVKVWSVADAEPRARPFWLDARDQRIRRRPRRIWPASAGGFAMAPEASPRVASADRPRRMPWVATSTRWSGSATADRQDFNVNDGAVLRSLRTGRVRRGVSARTTSSTSACMGYAAEVADKIAARQRFISNNRAGPRGADAYGGAHSAIVAASSSRAVGFPPPRSRPLCRLAAGPTEVRGAARSRVPPRAPPSSSARARSSAARRQPRIASLALAVAAAVVVVARASSARCAVRRARALVT